MEEFKGSKFLKFDPEFGLVLDEDGLNVLSEFEVAEEVANANGHLFEAAPKMLEALQKLCFLNSCELEGVSSGMPSPEDWRKAFEKSESVINKALGK